MSAKLALSVQQPWAWLIVNGHKDIENRDWPTRVRGTIAIHAGKKIDTAAIAWVRREFPAIPLPTTFETGGIVGYATLEDCVTESESDWFMGDYGFVLRDQRPCGLIPLRGQLGFFPASVPPSALPSSSSAPKAEE